jgi:Rieske Fe-S protein
MPAARGDSKPCTHAGCTGHMHFRREEGNELRWVCDKDAQHK